MVLQMKASGWSRWAKREIAWPIEAGEQQSFLMARPAERGCWERPETMSWAWIWSNWWGVAAEDSRMRRRGWLRVSERSP